MSRSADLTAYLALGSNLVGPWGPPRQCLARAIGALQRRDLQIVAVSPLFKTVPLGPRQPSYVNAVIAVRCAMPVTALLRLAKVLERQAGRRQRTTWGPRTLDIDVLMAGVTVYNWPFRRPGIVTLPHPELHRRAFVLVPLTAIAPGWRHPCLGLTAGDMLRRLSEAKRRDVVKL